MSKGIAGRGLYIGTWQRDNVWNKDWLRGRNLPDWAFDNQEQRQSLEHAVQVNDESVLLAETARRIKERPLSVLATWLARSRTMWVGTRSDIVTFRLPSGSFSWTLFKSIMWGMNTILLLLGLTGLVVHGLSRSPLTIFSAVIAYVYLIYLPFINIETRYSMPALPWLCLFALLLIADLRHPYKERIADALKHLIRRSMSQFADVDHTPDQGQEPADHQPP